MVSLSNHEWHLAKSVLNAVHSFDKLRTNGVVLSDLMEDNRNYFVRGTKRSATVFMQ